MKSAPRRAIWLATALLAGVGNAASAGEGSDASGAGVVEKCGISKGLCSVLGCGDGSLAVEIAHSSGFLIHVLAPDAAAEAEARRTVEAAGLYGRRVVVERGRVGRLPYADNIIDALVAADLDEAKLRELSLAEILRVLRPGGKALFLSSKSGGASLATSALMEFLKGAGTPEISSGEDAACSWAVLKKPPMPGTDNWTHVSHGPDNNPLSRDEVIKGPYRTQWIGDPFFVTMPAVSTIAGGKIFLAMGHIAHHKREEPWLNTLIARNGWNGTVLWERKLPEGYMVHRSAFIASDDAFYMIDGDRCLTLDPETGAETGEIRVPGLKGEWKWMALQDGVLYALAGGPPDYAETTRVRSQASHWSWKNLSKGYYEKRVPWGIGRQLGAYDMEKKKTLWVRAEPTEIDARAMALGDGNLYAYSPNQFIQCYEAKTGKPIWTNRDPQTFALIEELPEDAGKRLASTPGFRSSCYTLCTPEALFFEAQTLMNVVAVSAKDGRLLWHRPKTTSNPNLLYADGRLLVGIGPGGSTLALDPLTGEMTEDLGFAKRSCTRLTGCPDAFFVRGEGLLRYDRASKKVFVDTAVRAGCQDGAMPANGLLYVGPWPCDCNLQLLGTVALCPAGEFRLEEEDPAASRLELGEGDLKAVAPLAVSAQDWPTYRTNNEHTAGVPVAVSAQEAERWTFRPPASFVPSVPTAAGGLVFLGGDDGKVRAIDAAGGRPRWTFLTAGPIKAPPTVWDGRAYVGSGDGWVYCLEAATGRLLWRFRAALAERKIPLYGALCSTWPVNSGALVHDGIAYAAAGLIDYDGAAVCALDALSGRLVWENKTIGRLDPERRKGVSPQGHLTVADGKLWLAGGHMVSPAVFDLKSGECLNRKALPRLGNSNRGQEVLLFDDRLLIFGGRLLYSTLSNVVSPAQFWAYSTAWGGEPPVSGLTVASTGVAPAWNDKTFALINGRNTPPACCDRSEVSSFLELLTSPARVKEAPSALRRGTAGAASTQPKPMGPKRRWTAQALKGIDTVSLAVAENVVLAVSNLAGAEAETAEWAALALRADNGEVMWKRPLPSEPLPGGLLIDRDGQVIVVMIDGTVVCFGKEG